MSLNHCSITTSFLSCEFKPMLYEFKLMLYEFKLLFNEDESLLYINILFLLIIFVENESGNTKRVD